MELMNVEETAIVASEKTLPRDAMARFLAYLDVTPKTQETYTGHLKQFAFWMAENGITAPTRTDILAYRDSLKERCKPSTVQAYMTVVRVFFQWCADEGLWANVAQRVKGAKVSKGFKKDYLTASQVQAITSEINRDTLNGARDYAIFALMVACGLRTIEVSRANVEDLRTVGTQTVLYIQGKGREEKAEAVIIPPQVEKAIRAYFAKRGKVDGTAPLFASTANRNAGERMTTHSISRIAKSAMRNAGYDSDRLTAHSLRHTAISTALLNGRTIDQAQQFARHSNINTTMIYAHHLDAMANDCANVVADAFFKMAE